MANKMLEINCNKCENLIDKNAGCKLYGSNPEKAVNACANDQFKNYKPGCGDLISRSALIAEYDRVHVGAPGGARKLMEDAPSVDAVEVVRCKNCNWWKRNRGFSDSPTGHCFARDDDTVSFDFCSFGVMKVEPETERECNECPAEDIGGEVCEACAITYSWERGEANVLGETNDADE